MVLRVVVGFILNIFTSHFNVWGYPMGAVAIYLFLRSRIHAWIAVARGTLGELKERFMAWRIARWQQALGATVVVGVLVAPLAVKTTSEFVLEPGGRAEVRAMVPGIVSEVTAREGQPFPAGGALAALRNPEIEARAAVVARELSLAENSLRNAQARMDFAAMVKPTEERRRLLAEKAEAELKLQRLTLRAPLTGVVTTPRIEQRVGEYLKEGDPFALLVDRSVMRARVLVRDWELEDVQEGARVDLKLTSSPFQTFTGNVRAIMPAASSLRPVSAPHKVERKGQELTNFFEVTMEFPNPEGALQEGMTGTAKIYGKRYPLAWQMARCVYRWARSQIW
jgi:multidrug efflux pump subunit AcrA (membrane-fusion protein)